VQVPKQFIDERDWHMGTKNALLGFFGGCLTLWSQVSWCRKAVIILFVLIVIDGFRPPSQQLITRGMVCCIQLYQRFVSRGIMEPRGIKICRYTPTCSEYTKQALIKYGLYKGTIMGMYRIARCNPWSKGGEDYP
jgi:uncharacterized protein